MNRHARRADMRRFRRSDLLTHIVAADDSAALGGHKLLKDALASWQADLLSRKAICIGCKAPFADLDAKVGAYLFAMPVNVDGLVSTSAFCHRCWRELSPADVERQASRVLRQLLPGGRFLDAR